MRGSSLAATLLLAGALAAGCASPTERFDARAATLTLERGTVPGEGFTRVVYRRPGATASRVLHVYLDGVPAGSLTVVPEYDHVCCWIDLWPRVLAELGRR
jgi:hypothetical protein